MLACVLAVDPSHLSRGGLTLNPLPSFARLAAGQGSKAWISINPALSQRADAAYSGRLACGRALQT